MKNEPEISVLLPTYNGEEYVVSSIESLIVQTFEDFEVVVVDDGSTDETVRTICKNINDSRVKIHAKEKNKGFTAAMNTAIDIAEGTFLAYQGQDDFSTPNRLARQREILYENPDIELVHSPAEFINSSGDVIETRFGENRSERQGAPFYNMYKYGMHVAAPSIMMKRRHLKQLPDAQKWGRPEIKISSDYEHALHVAHNYEIHGMNEPVIKMLRGDDHEFASQYPLRNLGENLDVLSYIHNCYRNDPPVVDKALYKSAMSNCLARYGQTVMLQGRFGTGGLLLLKGFYIKPTNSYWFRKVFEGVKIAVDHYLPF